LRRPQSLTCTAVAQLEIGQASSGADGVLQHPPAACDGVEMVPTMGGEAMAAPRAVVVVAGGITLVCPMPPAPLDDHHDLLLGVPDGRPHLVPRVPHLWGLNVRHDVREDLRGTLWDGPHPAEPHAAAAAAPGALRSPGWAVETCVAFTGALAPGT
jgi:hypothetical protein